MTGIDSLRTQVRNELLAYIDQQRTVIQASYGEASLAAAEQLFTEALSDKQHYPGILVMLGYTLEQGDNASVIVPAVRAIELLAASARLAMSADNYAAARLGYDLALVTLANMPDITEANRIKAVSITSHSSLLHTHGVVNMHDDGRFAVWRGPHFFWLNPMHVGMVLAGADCHGTDDITAYMLALGAGEIDRAAQILQTLQRRWPAYDLLTDLHTDVSVWRS